MRGNRSNNRINFYINCHFLLTSPPPHPLRRPKIQFLHQHYHRFHYQNVLNNQLFLNNQQTKKNEKVNHKYCQAFYFFIYKIYIKQKEIITIPLHPYNLYFFFKNLLRPVRNLLPLLKCSFIVSLKIFKSLQSALRNIEDRI